MTGDRGIVFRRLILEVGHSATDAATMRTAAEFARLLGLDLHGLFIEDESLLALAELPFAREIRLPSHQWHPVDPARLEADMRHAAGAARRRLDEVVRGAGVPNGFEIMRGDPAVCIVACAEATDIVVAETGPAAVRVHGLGRVQEAAHGSPASVLVLPPGPVPRHGAVVVAPAGAADTSLDVAVRIARAADEDLLILLAGAPPSAVDERTHAEAAGMPPNRVHLRPVAGMRSHDLALALADEPARLIVLTRGASAAGDFADAVQLAIARGVPILLVESAMDDAPAAS